MKKLSYLIVLIVVLGLIVSGCIPVVPPAEQDESSSLISRGPTKYVDDDWQIEVLPPYAEDTDGDNYFATIQAAIDAASDGEIILVAPGEYSEDGLVADIYRSNLMLQSTGGPTVTIIKSRGMEGDGAVRIRGADDGTPTTGVTVDGFTVYNTGTANSGAGIFIGGWFAGDMGRPANNNTVKNCIIGSTTDQSLSPTNGVYLWNTTGNTIQSNIIYKARNEPANFGCGIIAWGGLVGQAAPSPNNQIIDNEIYDSDRWGVFIGADTQQNFGNTSIRENTITGNGHGIGVYNVVGCDTITINFNNIYDNTGYGIWSFGCDANVDATNNWWGHASGPSGEGGRWNSAHTKIIGKGDAVSLNVNWDPRLPQPVDHTPHHPVPTGLLIDTVKVGLVFDIGDVEHLNTFNDSAYQGIEWATADFNIEHIELEPEEAEDREEYLRILALMDCDLVIGVGWLFTDAITTVADEFPDTKFAIIDGYELIPDIPNLVSLLFKEHEGSFLVGMIAGLKAKDDDKDTVGFVGGRDIPLIHKFEAGYKAGVQYVYPKCKILSDYAGAFDDPAKGKELALAQYDEGAWVIYHASGATGEGVFEAGKERKRYVIGVDYNQNYKGYIEETGESFGLTSMLKQVNVTVYLTIKSVVEGTFEGGIELFGLDTEVTIGGKLYYGVDYALDEYNEHSVTPEMIAQVEEARDKIISGEIIVPDS